MEETESRYRSLHLSFQFLEPEGSKWRHVDTEIDRCTAYGFLLASVCKTECVYELMNVSYVKLVHTGDVVTQA